MAIQVGSRVLYNATPEELPMSSTDPVAAIVTAWDENSQLASLAIFPEGVWAVMAKKNVPEGDAEGQFMALRLLFRRQKMEQQVRKTQAK